MSDFEIGIFIIFFFLFQRLSKMHFSMENLSKVATQNSSSSASPASSFMSSHSCESIFRSKNVKNNSKTPNATIPSNEQNEEEKKTENGVVTQQ